MYKEVITTLRQAFGVLLIVIITLLVTVFILLKKIDQLEHQQFIPQFTEQQMQQICIEEEI